MSAIVDIEAAKARLAKLDAEREPLLALIRAAEAYEGVVGRTLFENDKVVVRQRPRPAIAGRPAPIMQATENAVEPILEMLGPLPISELVNLLKDKPELQLSADNASNILSARLSNSDKFVGRRGVGWWFKDRPWPEDGRNDEEDADMYRDEP